MSKREIERLTVRLLNKAGFDKDGNLKGSKSKSVFALSTPMGNGSR